MNKKLIEDFIKSIEAESVPQWSKRKNRTGHYFENLKLIRKMLVLISGNDTVNMIKAVLTSDDIL